MVGIAARTIEAHPADYREIAPVHQELLTKNGVYTCGHKSNTKIKSANSCLYWGYQGLEVHVQGIVNPIAIR